MLSIREQAGKITGKYKTHDPRELCDYMNITIIDTPLCTQIQGFFIRVENDFYIYINSALSEVDKIITLAHELGHRVLHPDLNSLFMTQSTLMRPTRYEAEADLFAAHLLIDDEVFTLGGFGYDTLEQISLDMNIPLHFVEIKWSDLTMQ